MKPHTPMTKSPRAVAREALRLAQDALPAYSAPRSRKDFTQHQLFAVLALKAFLKTDYRGVARFLADFAELRDDLGLAKAPHDSTPWYAAGPWGRDSNREYGRSPPQPPAGRRK